MASIVDSSHLNDASHESKHPLSIYICLNALKEKCKELVHLSWLAQVSSQQDFVECSIVSISKAIL